MMEDLDELEVKQSQVKQIISLLRNEFNLRDNEEFSNNENREMSGGGASGDTGFNDESSDTGEDFLLNQESQSIEDKKTSTEENLGFEEEQEEEETVNGFNDQEYLATENDLDEKIENKLEKLNLVIEFVNKAISFGANALDLSKRGLKKLPKNLLQLTNLQVGKLELKLIVLNLLKFNFLLKF
jgi:hypothetical protein